MYFLSSRPVPLPLLFLSETPFLNHRRTTGRPPRPRPVRPYPPPLRAYFIDHRRTTGRPPYLVPSRPVPSPISSSPGFPFLNYRRTTGPTTPSPSLSLFLDHKADNRLTTPFRPVPSLRPSVRLLFSPKVTALSSTETQINWSMTRRIDCSGNSDHGGRAVAVYTS